MLRILATRSFRPFEFRRAQYEQYPFDTPVFGVYVHVPFCSKLCGFCPYCKTVYEKHKCSLFVRSLIQEIEKNSPTERLSADSVYFGGGSPALLGSDLIQVMASLRQKYRFCEAGIELHPTDIDLDTGDLLRAAGFTMASVGVQSFNEEVLRTLGRDPVDSVRRVMLLQKSGISALDVDLMLGVPGQTTGIISEDFKKAVDAGATQVSCYAFMRFSYARDAKQPLTEIAKRRMLESVDALAPTLGFERRSIWTFVQRHAPQYSSVTRDAYIGYGPSAVSLSRSRFAVNTFCVDRYTSSLESGVLPDKLCLHFSPRARYAYWVFWRAYSMDICFESFRHLFSADLTQVFGREFRLLSSLGLLEKTASGYTLTSKGAYLFHLTEQHYTHRYIDSIWRTCVTGTLPERVVLH